MGNQRIKYRKLAKELVKDGLAIKKLIKSYAEPIARSELGDKEPEKKEPLPKLIKKFQDEMKAKMALVGNIRAAKSVKSSIPVAKSSTGGCCENRIPIVISDAQSFEILEPGYYFLQKNEIFNPASGYPAINIIATENVTIDFCGYALTQGNNEPLVFGILFGSPVTSNDYHNIKITNGSIRNFTDVGIFLFNEFPFSGTKPSTEISITDMNILDCGSPDSDWDASGIVFLTAGWFFFSLFGALGLKDIVIRNCKVNRSVGNGGVIVAAGDNIIIENTEILDTTDGGELGFGNLVGLTTIGRNITIDKVNVNGTTSGVEVSDSFADNYDCFRSFDITIRDSSFNDGFGSNCVPIFLAANIGVQIFNITANNGTSTVDGVGNFIDRCNNVYCENSQFCDLKALDASGNNAQCAGAFIQGAGVGVIFPDQLAGNNIKFVNCKFNNIFGENSPIIQGVNNSAGYNQVFEGCQFNSNRGGIGAGTGTGAGIVCGLHVSDSAFQTTSGDGYKYINCQFNDHVKEEGARSSVFGHTSITKRNILFDGCEAINITNNSNRSDVNSAYGFTADMSLFDPLPSGGNNRHITYRNCVVSDIFGQQEVIGYAFGMSDGFIRVPRLGPGEVLNCIIENCIAERIHSASSSDYIVAGIVESYNLSRRPQDKNLRLKPKMMNLSVTGNKVIDVKSNKDEPSPLSAGILVESVENPILQNNIINDCDRGVLFTGTNKASRNGFRLAATKEDALADPPVFLDITEPLVPDTQNFFNTDGSVNVFLAFVIPIFLPDSFLIGFTEIPDEWETGLAVTYNPAGEPYPELVPGQTYFLIVNRPGFTNCGLVKNNDVTNCSVTGYQDDRHKTSSAWVANTAFNNGDKYKHNDNYRINWACKAPVSRGNLACYPQTSKNAYNLSILKNNCKPKRKHKCKSKRKHKCHHK